MIILFSGIIYTLIQLLVLTIDAMQNENNCMYVTYFIMINRWILLLVYIFKIMKSHWFLFSFVYKL